MRLSFPASGAAKSVVKSTVKLAATFPSTRSVLNAMYLALSPSQKRRFHAGLSRLFRQGSLRGRDGTWKVVFARKTIYMPLSARSFWLDWDSAVSILGHDIDVKQTYETLLVSQRARPELFIDVGANYGTHSLLFLVHGVDTLSFEPNSRCESVFRLFCELNGVVPRIENVALGARGGVVEIAFPECDTWFGSTNPDIIETLSRSETLIRQPVVQKTLDDYLPAIAGRTTLIKIDTEGNELAVLQGALGVLREVKPTVIFESHPDSSRRPIYEFLGAQRYSVSTLPYDPVRERRPLGLQQFVSERATNFAAVPA